VVSAIGYFEYKIIFILFHYTILYKSNRKFPNSYILKITIL